MKAFRKVLAAAFLAVAAASSAHAQYVTVGPTTAFSINIDNGVVYLNNQYVNGPQCASQRAEIRDTAPYSAVYANRLYALLLSAKLSGLPITFTYSTATGPTCLLTSVSL